MDHDLPGFKGQIHDPHMAVRELIDRKRAESSSRIQFETKLPQTVAGLVQTVQRQDARLEDLEGGQERMKEALNEVINRINGLTSAKAT